MFLEIFEIFIKRAILYIPTKYASGLVLARYSVEYKHGSHGYFDIGESERGGGVLID